MGDPKKHRKKYTTPSHPWQKDRLDYENELRKEYGLNTKKEIYRMDSFLRRIKSLMKKLSSSHSKQALREQEQLLFRLKKLKLLGGEASIDTVLGLKLENLLDRRLQSIVFKKGLAGSMKQARQFIVHEHIAVGDKKITSPSYLVSETEEAGIGFNQSSQLSKEEHPERTAILKDIKKEIEKTKIVKEKKPIDIDLDVPEIVQPEEEAKISEKDAEEIKEAVEEDSIEEKPKEEDKQTQNKKTASANKQEPKEK